MPAAPRPGAGCGGVEGWEVEGVEPAREERLPSRPHFLSLQALAISDHFPVEVTLKSH